jgi:hypothetical protein
MTEAHMGWDLLLDNAHRDVVNVYTYVVESHDCS